MPTFRNDTKRWIDCWPTIQTGTGPMRILVRFEPDEERKLKFWLPWREKGLTLVDANEPPVPPVTLSSGTYDFEPGMSREFQIPPCDRYIVDLIVQSGRVKLYAGDDPAGADIVKNELVPYRYRAIYDWERAPRLRVVGMEENTRVTLHAEAGYGRIEDLPCR